MSRKRLGPPRCPYCKRDSVLVPGTVLYPHRADLAHVNAYICTPCDARVGCHDGTTRPKGRLANAELRSLRMDAHRAFDPLWKSGAMRRKDAYAWLAEKLGIPAKICHIAYFNEDECRRAVVAVAERTGVAA